MTKISHRLCRVLPSVTLILAVSVCAEAYTSIVKPAIDHQRVGSVPNDGFPQVEAVIESDIQGEEIRKARACFRAEQHPDFYCVDMEKKEESVLGCSQGDVDHVFVGVLPMPQASTAAIVYYIEASDDAFVTERTQVHTAMTSSEPVGARFPGTEPEITVIATVAGAPEIPPGFRASGIVAFVSVAGVAASLGGGLGTTAVVGTAAAAGAAAAGVGVLASGSESSSTTTMRPDPTSTTTSTPPPTTTSSTPPTTVQPPTPKACFSTLPDPPRVLTNESVRFDPACSLSDRNHPRAAGRLTYRWDFGDGRPGIDQRIPSRVFLAPGEYEVTLTVTNETSRLEDTTARTVTVDEPGADLAVILTAPTRYVRGTGGLFLGFEMRNNGPSTAREVVFTYTEEKIGVGLRAFGPGSSFTTGPGTCVPSGGSTTKRTFTCRAERVQPGEAFTFSRRATPAAAQTRALTGMVTSATRDPNASNDFATASTLVTQKTTDGGRRALDVDVTAELDVPPNDGALAASVIVNGFNIYPANNGRPSRPRWQALAGANQIVARVDGVPEAEGRWQFDFSTTPLFVRGSLRVESGEVVATGPSSVVFHVNGNPGQEFRITFDLVP